MSRSVPNLLASALALLMAGSIGTANALGPAGNLSPGPGRTSEKKVCTHTYNPDGTRCTFCYYTTQPGSGSTVCIKIKSPQPKQSQTPPSPGGFQTLASGSHGEAVPRH